MAGEQLLTLYGPNPFPDVPELPNPTNINHNFFEEAKWAINNWGRSNIWEDFRKQLRTQLKPDQEAPEAPAPLPEPFRFAFAPLFRPCVASPASLFGLVGIEESTSKGLKNIFSSPWPEVLLLGISWFLYTILSGTLADDRSSKYYSGTVQTCH